MKRVLLLGAALGALLFSPAFAQAVPAVPPAPVVLTPPSAPVRLHGVIKSFDGQYLTLKIDSGKTVVVGIDPTTRIVHGRMLKLADIHTGDFIGATAIPGADSKLRAQGVRIFAEQMRGSGEGLYPMESNPLRTITNATVAQIVPSASGGTLKLSFHGAALAAGAPCTGRAVPGGCMGTAELIVARGVPIVSMSLGDSSLLLPGAIVSASTQADATTLLVATSITVEREGKPAPAPLLPSVP